jgi:hypothetical protein
LQTIEPDPGKVAPALIQSLAPPAGESILTALLNEMAALPDAPSKRAGQRFMTHPFAILVKGSGPIYSSLAHPPMPEWR